MSRHATLAPTGGRAARPHPPVRAQAGSALDRLGNSGLQRTARRVQAKAVVGHADDPAEAQADAIADQVVGGSCCTSCAPAGCGDSSDGPPGDEPVLRREAADGASGAGGSDASHALTSGLGGGGHALPAALRSEFEPVLGGDFSRVRLHTDRAAGESARVLGAHAYAYGNDIAFAPGRYRPEEREGRRLLVHELVHVMQQGDVVRRDEAKTSSDANDDACHAPPGFSGPLQQCTVSESGNLDWKPPQPAGESLYYRGYILTADPTYLRYVMARIIADLDFFFAWVYINQLEEALKAGTYEHPIEDSDGNRKNAELSDSELALAKVVHPLLEPIRKQLQSEYETFADQVRTAAVIRLRANYAALGAWTWYVDSLLPKQLMGQTLAVQELTRYEKFRDSGQKWTPHGSNLDLYEQWSWTASPYRRAYKEMLGTDRIHGGCMDCHVSKTLDEWEQKDPLWATRESGIAPALRMKGYAAFEKEMPSPAPVVPGAQSAPLSVPPDYYQDAGPKRPGTQAMLSSIDEIKSKIVPLGEAAYRVLPRDVLNSSLTPENLVAKVLANIEKRRAGYLELIAAIEAHSIDWLRLRAMVDGLVLLADPHVQIMVAGALQRQQQAESDAEVFGIVGGIASALLTIFPPTAPLGLALGFGLAVQGVAQGWETYQQGQFFDQGIGGGVFTREQEDAAEMMKAMGVLTMAISAFDIAGHGIQGVKMVRSGFGEATHLARIEAKVGENRVVVEGLDGESPRITVTDREGGIRVRNVADIETTAAMGTAEGADNAIRSSLSAELGPGERSALEATRNLEGAAAAEAGEEVLESELAVVGRRKPKPIAKGDYIEEVTLENGHTWRRRNDGRWCRFSDDPVCFVGVDPTSLSKGAALANQRNWPKPPDGHHWATGPNGEPFLRRNPGFAGTRQAYTPGQGFSDVVDAADTSHLPDISGTFDLPEPHVDNLGRSVQTAEGELGVPGTVHTHRSQSAQRAVSTGTGDDAGHLLGNRFGAPGDGRNLARQNWIANEVGTFKALEDYWDGQLRSGTRIRAKVSDFTRPGAERPYMRVAEWSETLADGTVKKNRLVFANFDTVESRTAAGYVPTSVPGGGKVLPGRWPDPVAP